MISITTVIQYKYKQAGLLIPDFGSWRHEERDTNIKSLCQPYYADPTPTRGASCDA